MAPEITDLRAAVKRYKLAHEVWDQELTSLDVAGIDNLSEARFAVPSYAAAVKEQTESWQVLVRALVAAQRFKADPLVQAVDKFVSSANRLALIDDQGLQALEGLMRPYTLAQAALFRLVEEN